MAASQLRILAVCDEVDPRLYGFSKLISLARAQDYLEVEQNEGAPRVRPRPKTPQVTSRTRKRSPAKKAASPQTG